MPQHDADPAMERLAVFVGEWRMVPRFSDLPAAEGARVVFEWMPGARFLMTITGAFEICHDGTTWEHDFDVTYTRVGQPTC